MSATDLSLAALRAELAPIVVEARRTAPRTGSFAIHLTCSPLAVAVVLRDGVDGEHRTFVGVPTDGLAEAVAGLLSDLLEALPSAQRRNLELYVARRPEAIAIESDAGLRAVRVLLDPGGDADLVTLATLTDETRH